MEKRRKMVQKWPKKETCIKRLEVKVHKNETKKNRKQKMQSFTNDEQKFIQIQNQRLQKKRMDLYVETE